MIKGALGRGWTVDMRMQRDRACERSGYDVNVVREGHQHGGCRGVGMG